VRTPAKRILPPSSRNTSGLGKDYDCLACGRCCFAGTNYVQLFPDDLVLLGAARVAALTVGSTLEGTTLRAGEDGTERFMKMKDGHCISLGAAKGHYPCDVYEDRPLLCRVYEAGSPACEALRAKPEWRACETP
jgi:Fe-S-cluster containining protein